MEEEKVGQPRRSKEKKEEFSEKYLGLSRREVALRELMAKKFGGQANHLQAKKQAAAEEEKKSPQLMVREENKVEESKESQEESKRVNLPIRTTEKNQKLRQLQEESERYRACIESGHQLLQPADKELSLRKSQLKSY